MDLTDSIAIAALTVSLMLAAWETIKFKREGAWVRVTLRPGTYDGTSLRTMTYRVPEDSPKFGDPGARFDIEVAVVEVENRGRTPVTVRSVTLEFGRRSWRRPWRPVRQSLGFKPLPFEGAEEKTRVRIEAFDSATFIFDACHALPVIKKRSARARVRAAADVAGGKAVLSPRAKAWKFDAEDRPWLFDIGTFDLARQIYRFLAWRVRGETGHELMLPDFAMKVAALVESGQMPTRTELKELVRGDQDDNFSLRMATFDLAPALADPLGGLLDGTGINDQRLARAVAKKREDAVEGDTSE